MRQQAGIRFLVRPGAVLAKQLPGNDGSFLKAILPDMKGHHALVHWDNMTVVANINHQGGLRSCPLYKLVRSLLLWAQHNIRLVKAVQVPDRLNGHAVPEQSVSRGMETPYSLDCLQASGGQTVRLLAQLALVCLTPGSSSPSGHQTNQGGQTLSPSTLYKKRPLF